MVSGTGPDESGKYSVKNIEDRLLETNSHVATTVGKFKQALALNLGKKSQ